MRFSTTSGVFFDEKEMMLCFSTSLCIREASMKRLYFTSSGRHQENHSVQIQTGSKNAEENQPISILFYTFSCAIGNFILILQ